MGEKLKDEVLDLLDSRAATVLYRSSSFLLLLLVSVCAWIATSAISDIKEVSKELQKLNSEVVKLVQATKFNDTAMIDLSRRVQELERDRLERAKGRP